MARFELLIATRNEGKIEELCQSFATLPVELRFLHEFKNVSDVPEVGKTYQENATLKATGYASQTGIPALADDSGLEVDALRGGPGVWSARFGGSNLSDKERTEALLSALHDVGAAQRTARFVCCMVLYGSPPSSVEEVAAPRVLAVARAICEGMLATKPMGTQGFGFDPIFIPNGHNVPFAALDQAIKGNMSHRARAAAQMRRQLEHYCGSNLTGGRTAS
jgi:XTP/dITP diphosphohydrolase